ncbi:MAG TPA: peptidylprolyl isomerase [Bacteroidales bacterium]|nr:peptidylprolyl isomerase [Bacteroidales bacterium]
MKKCILLYSLLILSCSMSTQAIAKSNIVLIETSMGNIKIRLYDETPQHRDNFLKLVEKHYYDSLIFHRVIKGFMVQGGDPESKGAPADKRLGSGNPGYTIPAEIVYPQLFHKRGALSAARTSDQVNPLKASSGSQFYIVWGDLYSEVQLAGMEDQKRQKAMQNYFQSLAMQHMDSIQNMQTKNDTTGLSKLQAELVAQTESEFKKNPSKGGLTAEQKKAYSTIGGTPHLDGEYTVFGEVIEGLDVVGKIQAVETGEGDRPKVDIIMKMSIVQ